MEFRGTNRFENGTKRQLRKINKKVLKKVSDFHVLDCLI